MPIDLAAAANARIEVPPPGGVPETLLGAISEHRVR
jgi:hypothetical protein